VQIDPYAPARALTATQIATLGRAPFYEPAARGRAAFRHSVLYDAPEPVRPLPDRCKDQPCLRQIVGQMVHCALQAWVLPGNSDSQVFFDRLATYAWELHITDPLQLDEAVYAASELLKRFELSDVPARLESASQVYRELPFMHRIGQQTINGVLDVLYHDRYGKWHVLDYKTASVTEQGARSNARRYTLQIGVYASAVESKTGQMPDAHLYYIYPGTLIEVRPKDWRAALARLEDDVRAALDSPEP